MSLSAEKRTPVVGMAMVDIWSFHLDAPGVSAARLASLLSAEERQRADRFIRAQDAARFRVGRARLREILARYLAVDPQAIVFGYGTHGKPHIAAPVTPLRFNLTHSDERAAVAVSRTADVGIDIERIQPLEDPTLEDIFSPRERMALAALTGSERCEAFYRCWTRKEALIKAHGAGLDIALDSFDVPVGRDEDFTLTLAAGPSDRAGTWRVVSFAPSAGYAGAVAVASGPSQHTELAWRRWPDEG